MGARPELLEHPAARRGPLQDGGRAGRQPGLLPTAHLGLRLLRLGLDARTIACLLRALAELKLHPDRSWKKVSLQPIVNLAFFRQLFRRVRPDFATFHTNHAAHYQHRLCGDTGFS